MSCLSCGIPNAHAGVDPLPFSYLRGDFCCNWLPTPLSAGNKMPAVLTPSPQLAGEPVPQCARGEKRDAKISGVGTPPRTGQSSPSGRAWVARVGKTERETGRRARNDRGGARAVEISPILLIPRHALRIRRCLYSALFVFHRLSWLPPFSSSSFLWWFICRSAQGHLGRRSTTRWLRRAGKSFAGVVRLISMRGLFWRPRVCLCAAVACSVVERPGSVSEIRRGVYLHSLPIYTAQRKDLAHRLIRLRIMARRPDGASVYLLSLLRVWDRCKFYSWL